MDNRLLFHSLQSTPIPWYCLSTLLFVNQGLCKGTGLCVSENGLLDYYNVWAIAVLRAELLILLFSCLLLIF